VPAVRTGRNLSIARKKYNVFISYRRESAAELAQLIRRALADRGLRVFLDVRELGAGHFDTELIRRIREATDFVIVLTPGSLDRCREEGDWLRKEISCALRTKRNVVPVASHDFEFRDVPELPAELADLPRHQCAVYDHNFSDESITRIQKMLATGRHRFWGWWIAAVVTLLLSLSLATYRWLAPPRVVPAGSRTALISSPVETAPPLALYWHGFGQRFQDGKWSELVVLDGVTMYSGNQFRVVFSANEDCYAYLVVFGSDGSTSVLFPHEAINMDNRVRGGEQYSIPDGLNWFTLDDHPGTETIYLLAAYDPLEDLDRLLRKGVTPVPPERLRTRVEERIAALETSAEADARGEFHTEDGRVVVRGVDIQPDHRMAAATLASGEQVKQTMHFEQGDIRVVKRIRIRHEPRR
jgi:hypothetical protein